MACTRIDLLNWRTEHANVETRMTPTERLTVNLIR